MFDALIQLVFEGLFDRKTRRSAAWSFVLPFAAMALLILLLLWLGAG
jgi:hypothetical protein